VLDDGAYILGAPEMVLLEEYSKYEELIVSIARQGCRVLIFGTYEGVLDGKPLTSPVLPLAMVVLNNPVREEAKATFEYFKKQGVDIKVISGDNAVTVSHVAAKAGIAHAERFVDASILTTDRMLEEAALTYTVFGRVQPEQKWRE
jgi:cation-transporting ATPase E